MVKKNENGLHLTPYTKINSRLIKDLVCERQYYRTLKV